MPRVIQTVGLRNIIDAGAFLAFQRGLTLHEPEDLYTDLGTVVTTDRSEVRMPFLWYPPVTRRWEGERVYGSLNGGEHVIRTDTYESTVVIPRTTVEDDMVGEVERVVGKLGAEYMHFLHRQYINTLKNGTVNLSFDGFPLLSNNPAHRGNANTNLLNDALSQSSLQDAIAKMGLFTDPDGRPLHMRPTHLLVGPRQQFLARQLVESQTIVIAGDTDRTVGTLNPLNNMIQVVVSNYITTDDWFLIAAGSNVHRPAIRVDRRDVGIEFAAQTSPENDSVFRYDAYVYGYRVRHGFGAGAWYAVVGSLV